MPIQNMIDLKNKVVAVTGGASGIGRTTAILLASLGAKVSIGDLQKEALDSVAKEIKGNGHGDVFAMVIDIRRSDSVEMWINETVKWAGKLDGAANLAGVIGRSVGLMGVGSLTGSFAAGHKFLTVLLRNRLKISTTMSGILSWT